MLILDKNAQVHSAGLAGREIPRSLIPVWSRRDSVYKEVDSTAFFFTFKKRCFHSFPSHGPRLETNAWDVLPGPGPQIQAGRGRILERV